jgi:hypothetical protein
MLKQLTIAAILFAGILTPRSVFAQANTETKPVPAMEQRYYHLDFVVEEVEAGKVVNSRNYSTIIASNGQSSIRTGTKVPFNASTVPNAAQYMQIDVGVDIDCNEAKELNNQLMLHVKAEVSSLADPSEGSHPGAPVIRHNSWESNVVLPIRQPTTIFSSDDLASKRKMQLELTATPIK